MMDHIANHCEELHRRHVHILTVTIAVALSVGLYFVLPILLLAREIAMSTPVIHRFNVAAAEGYQYASSTVPLLVPVAPVPAGVSCPAGEVYTANNEGKMACVRMDAGQNSGKMPQQENFGPGGEGQQTDEEFIDPREIKLALNDIVKMKADLKRSATKLKKLQNTADDLQRITEIQAQLDQYQKDIKNPTEDISVAETIRDFRDNNFWEEIQAIRAKVEIPTELSRLSKDLVRVKKLVGNKTYVKLGFDMTAFGGRLDEIAANIKSIQDLYASGDLESAMDEMQNVRDGGQPGEIYGVLTRTRDILQRTKSIRSKDIQTQITEIIQPVIDSFNAGDYRDASQVLDQVSQELMQLQNKMMRATNLDEATGQKLERLQQMIDDKLGKQKDSGEPMPDPNNEGSAAEGAG